MATIAFVINVTDAAAIGGDKYYVNPGNYTEAADEHWMPYRIMAQKGYLEARN